jgi:hypothetical protein
MQGHANTYLRRQSNTHSRHHSKATPTRDTKPRPSPVSLCRPLELR